MCVSVSKISLKSYAKTGENNYTENIGTETESTNANQDIEQAHLNGVILLKDLSRIELKSFVR